MDFVPARKLFQVAWQEIIHRLSGPEPRPNFFRRIAPKKVPHFFCMCLRCELALDAWNFPLVWLVWTLSHAGQHRKFVAPTPSVVTSDGMLVPLKASERSHPAVVS